MKETLINIALTLLDSLNKCNIGTIVAAIVAFDRTKSIPNTILLSYLGSAYVLYVLYNDYKNKKLDQ